MQSEPQMPNPIQPQNPYTGPVWVKYNGEIVAGSHFIAGDKSLFRLKGRDGLKQHNDDMAEDEKAAALKGCCFGMAFPVRLIGVTEWWPRETWYTRVVGVARSALRSLGGPQYPWGRWICAYATLFIFIMVLDALLMFLRFLFH